MGTLLIFALWIVINIIIELVNTARFEKKRKKGCGTDFSKNGNPPISHRTSGNIKARTYTVKRSRREGLKADSLSNVKRSA